jgi:uncharacterized membrane protein YhaH (DUF805 family)
MVERFIEYIVTTVTMYGKIITYRCPKRVTRWQMISFYLVNMMVGVLTIVLDMLIGWNPVISDIGLLYPLFAAWVFVPGIILVIARLRDAGFKWTNLFWAFLPVIGWFIYLWRVFSPSVDRYYLQGSVLSVDN